MTWLCRLFGHAWGGTTWEDSHGLDWRHRKCRRCGLDQWATTLPPSSGVRAPHRDAFILSRQSTQRRAT